MRDLVVDLFLLDALILGLAGLLCALSLFIRALAYICLPWLPRYLVHCRARRGLRRDLRRLEQDIHAD